MSTATITSKGQVTIPLAVRQALGLQAGAQLDFLLESGSLRVVPLRPVVASLKGRFAGRSAAKVTLAMMDEAVATEAAARNKADSPAPKAGS